MYTPTSLLDAVRYFADPDHCHDFLTAARWPEGVTCPHCGTADPYVINAKRGRMWRCRSKECKRQFTVKVGTIFEDSPLGLDKWLPTLWLIANAKNGISSYEVSRDLGVTQKTAWFMLHRVRLLMQTDADDQFAGQVEVDETLIGGKLRNMHPGRKAMAKGRTNDGKVIVMGLLERHGKVRTKVVEDAKKETLQPLVKKHVKKGATVYTDELKSYMGLDKDFVHETINHAECYVQGHIHTNSIENFWSLFKRCCHGTYVSIEPFHLFRYLSEEEFRFNERKSTDGQRFAKAAGAVAGKRLTYRELIGQGTPLVTR
jgi:transposase-like protein